MGGQLFKADKIFVLDHPAIHKSLHVRINGITQRVGVDYTHAEGSLHVRLLTDFQASDEIECTYAWLPVDATRATDSTVLTATTWKPQNITSWLHWTEGGVEKSGYRQIVLHPPYRDIGTGAVGSGNNWKIAVGVPDATAAETNFRAHASVWLWNGASFLGEYGGESAGAGPNGQNWNATTKRFEWHFANVNFQGTVDYRQGTPKTVGFQWKTRWVGGPTTFDPRSTWNLKPWFLKRTGGFYLPYTGPGAGNGTGIHRNGGPAPNYSWGSYNDDGVRRPPTAQRWAGSTEPEHVAIHNSPYVFGYNSPGMPNQGGTFYHSNMEALWGYASGGSSDMPYWAAANNNLDGGWTGAFLYYRQGSDGDWAIRGRCPWYNPGSFNNGDGFEPLQLNYVPTLGTVKAFLNGVALAPADYTVDYTLNCVTVTPLVATAGQTLSATYEHSGVPALPYDVPREGPAS